VRRFSRMIFFAAFVLAMAFGSGGGVAGDAAEDLADLRAAAEQGNADAQLFLGYAYDAGQGVPQDFVLAHMWWNLAAAQGNARASEMRALVAKRMTPAQIAEAQRLAREWFFRANLGHDQDTLQNPVPQMDLPALAAGDPNLTTALLQGPGIKILNIWASWCGPCRVEHPKLMELAALGVTVYGINYKDDPAKARKFLTDLGDPFAIVGLDEKGRMGIEWDVYGVPETFVIDADGRITHKHAGPIMNDDLQTKILPAMREAGWPG
jgi:cytochrome c biogenesis protein CcmG/thiol:disulfide interchange protein DsbE